jgi:long-chain acyl-CoA synthetase
VAVAFVVPRPGARLTENTIIEHCRSSLAAYKRPRAVVFVSSLPTTSSGKVMRRKLAELDGQLRARQDVARREEPLEEASGS